MKTLVIYHDADFDGILSHEVCHYFLRKNSTVRSIGWDYGKPIPLIEDSNGPLFDQIFMVDISIEPLMEIPNLIWVDHHKTAIQRYSPRLPGYRLDGVAACRLCWQWFTNTNLGGLPTLEDFVNRNVVEPLLITLAGEHDIWDHHDPAALPLQDGLRQLEPSEWNDLVQAQFGDQIQKDVLLQQAITIGRRANAARQRSNASIMAKRSHTIQWHGFKWLVCNGVSGSQAFDSVVQPSHEGLMAWHYDGQTKMVNVSLYHSPDHKHLDHSIIAKEFSGGGHAGACGFQLLLDEFHEILEPFMEVSK